MTSRSSPGCPAVGARGCQRFSTSCTSLSASASGTGGKSRSTVGWTASLSTPPRRFFYKQLNDLWPTSFWVFIERDPAPVRQWITQVFPSLGSSPDAVMAQLEKALADAKRAVPDRSITCDFDKIDAGWMLPLVWERSKAILGTNRPMSGSPDFVSCTSKL